jgi:VIT1/CCC1 family predicted Fe2+/Mn2+ transporter
VTQQLTEHDALGAHARDEIGLSEATRARPIQAALASGAAFTAGASPPLLLVAFVPFALVTPAVGIGTIALLLGLGGLAARLGRASMLRGAARVAFWGAVAMACTALVGAWFGSNG